LSLGFNALIAAYNAGDLSSWISNSPDVKRPTLNVAEIARLILVDSTASLAVAYEQQGDPEAALKNWRLLLPVI
jgi:hypothetical protein